MTAAPAICAVLYEYSAQPSVGMSMLTAVKVVQTEREREREREREKEK